MLLKSTLALAAAGLVGAFASIAGAAEPRAVAIEDLTLVEEDRGDSPGADPDQYHHGGYHHGGYHHGHHGGYHHGEYHHGGYHGGYIGGYHGWYIGGYHGGYHGGYMYGGNHHYYNNQTPPTEIESVPAPKVDTEG